LKDISPIKLLIVFAVVFSFVSLPGILSSYIQFPTIPAVRAAPAPLPASCGVVSCVPWAPAGPASNTLLAVQYKDPVEEYTTGLSGNQIDLMDESLTASELSSLGGAGCPNNGTAGYQFYCTAALNEHGYFEVEFNLANTGQAGSTTVLNAFWGIPMQFGNSAKGVEIRQALAHLIDKNSQALNNPILKGQASAIDSPLPPCGEGPAGNFPCVNSGAINPNPCNWDPVFPQTSGAPDDTPPAAPLTNDCQVGAPGGTAYHIGLPGTTPACISPVNGATHDLWSPCFGSQDFCAAAVHFWDVGVASGPKPCSVAGDNGILNQGGRTLNATALANTPQLFIRTSPSRFNMGTALANEICELFGFGYTNPCTALQTTVGPFSAFVGFTTSTDPNLPNQAWGMYTAAFIAVFPFDSTLYFEYNSNFATKANGSPCASQVSTAAAGNYMNVCVPAYDSISTQMEFAPALNTVSPTCLSPTGTDPQFGQTTPTFGFCNNKTGVSVLDAVSAAYQAEDLYGQKVLTLPVWDAIDTFAYNRNFPPPGTQFSVGASANAANIENENGGSLTGLSLGFPNFLNGWCLNGVPFASLTSATPTCQLSRGDGNAISIIRQGFAEPTTSINPYIADSFWDFAVLGQVYDSLGFTNPIQANPPQLYDWMTTNSKFVSAASLGYTPSCVHLFPTLGTRTSANCLSTNGAYRMSLRADNVWHDGNPVTSWDVAFSYLTLNQTGAFQGAGLSPLNDVHVLSKFQFDLVVKAVGPFTQSFLMGPTILPGNFWSACGINGSNTWLSDVAAGSVPDNCMEPCGSGPVPCSANTGSVFNAHFDPDTQVGNANSGTYVAGTTGIVVGSGPWTCESTTGVLGGGCSSSGNQSPPIGGTWTFTRNGCTASSTGTTCPAPGHSPYFRSSGTFALCIWAHASGSHCNGPGTAAQLSAFLACFAKPAPCVNAVQNWNEGIGNPSLAASVVTCDANGNPLGPCAPEPSTHECPCATGSVQLSEFLRFFSINWLPIAGNSGSGDWTTYTGIAVANPILYEAGPYVSNQPLGNPITPSANFPHGNNRYNTGGELDSAQVLASIGLGNAGCSSPTLAAYPEGAGYDC